MIPGYVHNAHVRAGYASPTEVVELPGAKRRAIHDTRWSKKQDRPVVCAIKAIVVGMRKVSQQEILSLLRQVVKPRLALELVLPPQPQRESAVIVRPRAPVCDESGCN